MQLFYAPTIKEDLFLDEDESRHCVKVLRKKIGDQISIIDGRGNLYHCQIQDDHIKKCRIDILETIAGFGGHDYYLHIAIAPTKSPDRIEWFVEKAIEFGVDEITFVQCDHSERSKLKIDRVNRIAVSATKQSLKSKIPTINEVVSFKDFINLTHVEHKLIAHLEEGAEKKMITHSVKKGDNVCVLIGPEGDFSKNEIKLASKNGFESISLGSSRLRTETAGIAVSSEVYLINHI